MKVCGWIVKQYQYFTNHWLDLIILLLVVFVLILNCIKSYQVSKIKKGSITADSKCKFLETQKSREQSCTNPYHKQRFKGTHSCYLEDGKRCSGFLLSDFTETSIEELLTTSRWKYLVFFANWGMSLLPYVALIRTLLLAITIAEVN